MTDPGNAIECLTRYPSTDPTARIVRCGLAAGHDGPHCEEPGFPEWDAPVVVDEHHVHTERQIRDAFERPEATARRFATQLERLAQGLADRGIPLLDRPVDEAAVDTALAVIDEPRAYPVRLAVQACRRQHVDDPTPHRPLHDDLRTALNTHSAENGSNTPDFVLAHYLLACLDAFDYGVRYCASVGAIAQAATVPPPVLGDPRDLVVAGDQIIGAHDTHPAQHHDGGVDGG